MSDKAADVAHAGYASRRFRVARHDGVEDLADASVVRSRDAADVLLPVHVARVVASGELAFVISYKPADIRAAADAPVVIDFVDVHRVGFVASADGGAFAGVVPDKPADVLSALGFYITCVRQRRAGYSSAVDADKPAGVVAAVHVPAVRELGVCYISVVDADDAAGAVVVTFAGNASGVDKLNVIEAGFVLVEYSRRAAVFSRHNSAVGYLAAVMRAIVDCGDAADV